MVRSMSSSTFDMIAFILILRFLTMSMDVGMICPDLLLIPKLSSGVPPPLP